jgi:hypothetical protein
MPAPRIAVTLSLLAPFAAAQWDATYAPFGAGCAGTGTGVGGRTLLPAAAATTWGGGNAIPLGWTPCRYQQAFLGSELPTAFTMAGLSLRQPHTGPVAHGFTIDVEIRVGYTTRWSPTLSTTFASNWDVAPPVAVLPRALVDLPDQPAPPPSPLDVLTTIRWPHTFDWVPQPGRNLLVEITVFGNSVGGGIYGYPIDNLAGTPSLWGTPANATVANGGPVRGFGLVMGFDALTHTAVPRLFSTDTPQINNTFRVRVDQALPGSVALLLFGGSTASWNGLALPLDLASIGAPGCALLCDAPIASAFAIGAGGTGNVVYTLPNVLGALGSSFYNQAFVFDPAANALGFVASNGGHGVFGNQ